MLYLIYRLVKGHLENYRYNNPRQVFNKSEASPTLCFQRSSYHTRTCSSNLFSDHRAIPNRESMFQYGLSAKRI